MENKIIIDPLTRIEGHLRFETTVEDGVVTKARCTAICSEALKKR